MPQEMSKNLKAALYDRVSHPVISAYAVTWGLFNWRSIVQLMFSNETLEQRIAKADKLMFGESNSIFSLTAAETFLIPLSITALMLYLGPIIERVVFTHAERQKNQSRKTKEGLDKERLLTLEQSQKLKVEIALIRKANFDEIESKDKEFEKLKDDNNTLIEGIRAQTAQAEKDLAEANTQVLEKQKEIDTISTKLKTAEKEIAQTQTELSNLRELASDLAAKADKQDEKITQMVSENNKYVTLSNEKLNDLSKQLYQPDSKSEKLKARRRSAGPLNKTISMPYKQSTKNTNPASE